MKATKHALQSTIDILERLVAQGLPSGQWATQTYCPFCHAWNTAQHLMINHHPNCDIVRELEWLKTHRHELDGEYWRAENEKLRKVIGQQTAYLIAVAVACAGVMFVLFVTWFFIITGSQ